MKKSKWMIILGINLVVLSAIFYLLHYIIFKDMHHIFIYMVGDIAFLFIDVLVVTLIIDRLLIRREKRAILRKLNMVIGIFYGEVGSGLLKYFSNYDAKCNLINKELLMDDKWTDKKFKKVKNNIFLHECDLKPGRNQLSDLKKSFIQKRDFLIRLLENPNLMEHDKFTDLLFAVFHLGEEIISRKDIQNISDEDYSHIVNDIKRAYHLLIAKWLGYVNHLRKDYPFLFSFMIRTNPFNPDAKVEIA